jgi:large subunit ribosomal protein L4
MVEGSTRKLYKQKGTGNARVGNARTIIRKGGGVAFAKTRTSEDFRRDMPKSMRRLANRNALLAKLVDKEVKCVDSLEFKAPKTKEFQMILDAMGVNRSCLVALDKANHNAQLSARNIADVRTTMVHQLNVFDLLSHRFLVVDAASLKAFVEGTVWDNAEDEAKTKPSAKPVRKTAKEKA